MYLGNSQEVQWLGLRFHFRRHGMGWIPGLGTEIPHATGCAQKNKNKIKISIYLLLKKTRNVFVLALHSTNFPVVSYLLLHLSPSIVHNGAEMSLPQQTGTEPSLGKPRSSCEGPALLFLEVDVICQTSG